MTADTIPVRVARGVALLDEKRPGWRDRIDLDALDMRSSRDCVLGQLYADHEDVDWPHRTAFHVGATELLGDVEDAAAYGFENGAEFRDLDAADEYAELTAEWRRVITGRLAGAE